MFPTISRAFADSNDELKNVYQLEVFYPGEHTDMSGDKRVWTVDDIQGIADSYNAHVASGGNYSPIVVGHPENNAPAYGVIKNAFVKDGGRMWLTVAFTSELTEMVKAGNYPERSIMFTQDSNGEWIIKHLGLLGTDAPALPKLSQEGLPLENELLKKRVAWSFSIINNPLFKFNNGENTMNEEEVLALITTQIEPLSTRIGTIEDTLSEIRQMIAGETVAADSGDSNEGGDSQTTSEEGQGFSATRVNELEKKVVQLTIQSKVSGFQNFLNSESIACKLTKEMREGFISQYQAIAGNDVAFSTTEEDSNAVKNLKNLIQKLPDLVSTKKVAGFTSRANASTSGNDVSEEVKRMLSSLR